MAALCLLPTLAIAARPANPHRVKAISWNQAVGCTPFTATAADVQAGRFGPGIADPAVTSPPCASGHTSTFVLLHQMKIVGVIARDWAEGDTVYCDSVFTVEDPVAPGPGQKPVRIRCVIDRAWKRAALAPPEPTRKDERVEIQGFVWRNPAGQQWEMHPVTAWK